MNNQASNKYENAVFAFFTEPENFETMIRVNEHADFVMKKVILDFWGRVKDSVSNKLISKHEDWVITFAGNLEGSDGKMWAYRKSWFPTDIIDRPDIAVAFGNLYLKEKAYIGITINEQTTLYNKKNLIEGILALKGLNDYEHEIDEWWVCWKYFEIHGKNPESLISILPANREAKIVNLTDEAVKLAEILEENIEVILKKAFINQPNTTM